MSQDLPPVGGYEPVQYKRNLPVRGYSPKWYLFGMAGIMIYGFYEAIGGIKEQRELAREKLWARIHLTPVMQAETDRDLVRRVWAQEKREELLMSDVKGWKMGSVYNSDRFIRPTYTVTPGVITKGKPYFADWREQEKQKQDEQDKKA